MKKLFTLLLAICMLFFCSSCANTELKNDETTEKENISDTHSTYVFDIKNFYGTEWEKAELPVDLSGLTCFKNVKPIKTNQEAVNFANKILKEQQSFGKLPNYILFSVQYASNDNVWCFEYGINEPDTDGGCLTVAVNGKDGSFISATAGE